MVATLFGFCEEQSKEETCQKGERDKNRDSPLGPINFFSNFLKTSHLNFTRGEGGLCWPFRFLHSSTSTSTRSPEKRQNGPDVKDNSGITSYTYS